MQEGSESPQLLQMQRPKVIDAGSAQSAELYADDPAIRRVAHPHNQTRRHGAIDEFYRAVMAEQ